MIVYIWVIKHSSILYILYHTLFVYVCYYNFLWFGFFCFVLLHFTVRNFTTPTMGPLYVVCEYNIRSSRTLFYDVSFLCAVVSLFCHILKLCGILGLLHEDVSIYFMIHVSWMWWFIIFRFVVFCFKKFYYKYWFFHARH